MKTTITKRIDSETEHIAFGWWNEEKQEFIPIEFPDDFVKAATNLECSAQLIWALTMLTDNISENVHSDLADIWDRLDKAGID